MERDDAGFRAKSDNRQDKNNIFYKQWDVSDIRFDHIKIERASELIEEQEGKNDKGRADMGHYEI